MTNSNFYTVGKIIFAISILCIGIVHIVFKSFPIGFEPVSTALPFNTGLAYIFGALLIISAILMLSNKYVYQGSVLACLLLLIISLGMHLPKVLANIKNGGLITGLFEALALFSGALMLVAASRRFTSSLALFARVLFSICLLVYGILHIVYAQFVETLIPAWLPAHTVFNDLVIFGFFASAISFLINKFTNVAGLSLSAMFLLWFFILHLPRAFASPAIEPEWTSAFIALSVSGIALLTAFVSTKKAAQN